MDQIMQGMGNVPVLRAVEGAGPYDAGMKMPVDRERLLDFDRTLNKYKAGKARLEKRVIASENWWKLRNESEEMKHGAIGWSDSFRAKSGWLHNVIVSKHADAMENYPEPIILPREPGDREQAKTLSAVLPVIMQQNQFEKTYSDNMWQKLKTGTGVYQVRWDASKLNGLGDIAIERVDLLHLFWEPGITDIQKSRYVFHCEMVDNETLEEDYPQLKDKLKGNSKTLSQFVFDDAVGTDGKSLVVDVYYKVKTGGQTVLHYCKYVNDQVLASTENEGAGGLYEHGRYPFVLDPLWPIEGSPCGYGYVDLCMSAQTQIDMMDTAFTKNTMVGATPRYFQRVDGGINEKEFLDIQKPIVNVAGGSLDDNIIRVIDYKPLGGAYINVYENKIAELRQTSGNTETANGVSTSGVTAASAIAALQEASGKTSRDSTRASYQVYAEIVDLCIELVRQFYTLPRTFRITGEFGQESFAHVSNENMLPREVYVGNQMLGMVQPFFDVDVKVQKRNAFSRTAQNELALQLYGAGFFTPGQATPALICLDMMDFDGKDELMQKLVMNGTLQQQLEMTQQLVLELLAQYDPARLPAMQQAMGMQQQGGAPTGGSPAVPLDKLTGESGVTAKARVRANRATEAK